MPFTVIRLCVNDESRKNIWTTYDTIKWLALMWMCMRPFRFNWRASLRLDMIKSTTVIKHLAVILKDADDSQRSSEGIGCNMLDYEFPAEF